MPAPCWPRWPAGSRTSSADPAAQPSSTSHLARPGASRSNGSPSLPAWWLGGEEQAAAPSHRASRSLLAEAPGAYVERLATSTATSSATIGSPPSRGQRGPVRTCRHARTTNGQKPDDLHQEWAAAGNTLPDWRSPLSASRASGAPPLAARDPHSPPSCGSTSSEERRPRPRLTRYAP